MIKIFDKNSWKSDLFYLGIQFLVAWEVSVGITKISDILYIKGHGYLLANILVLFLIATFFLIYKHIELKPNKPLFITTLLLSLLNIMGFNWMGGSIIIYMTKSLYHPALQTYNIYIPIVFFLPAITYLLGFVGKKTFYLWAVIPFGMFIATIVWDFFIYSYPHLLPSLIAKFI